MATVTWSYDASLRKPKDQVRMLIQDTNTNRQLFQDAEIDWVLSTEANIYMAAALLCERLVVKAGGVKSKKIGNLSISYDPKLYMQMAGELRARGSGHQVPYAGGISVSDKDAVQQNTDWVQPKVQRGLDDNPAAPAPSIPGNNPLTSI